MRDWLRGFIAKVHVQHGSVAPSMIQERQRFLNAAHGAYDIEICRGEHGGDFGGDDWLILYDEHAPGR